MSQSLSVPSLFHDSHVCASFTNFVQVLSAPDKNRDAVVRVLERLVEATMGITREDMAQPQFAGLSALNFAELQEESIPELAFFRACSKMMEVSCVFDFSVNDLLHPTRQRLRRHLSAIINFCKFREERMMLYTQLAAQKEQCAMQASSLQAEQVELEKELAALKEQTAEEAKLTEEQENECSQVEEEIATCNRFVIKHFKPRRSLEFICICCTSQYLTFIERTGYRQKLGLRAVI